MTTTMAKNDHSKDIMVDECCMVPNDNFQNEIEIDGPDLCTNESFEIAEKDENIISYEEVADENGHGEMYMQDQAFQIISNDEESFPVVSEDCSFQQKDEHDDDMDIVTSDKEKGEYFILSTLDEVKTLINEYCERTSSHFVVHKKTKHFGSPGSLADISGHRIQWHDIRLANHSLENIIEFDGVPHIILGHYQLNCQFGADTSASQKQKRKKMKEDGEINVRSRVLKTPTKKCGCPAKILVKQIIRFPEFKIMKDTVRRKTTNSAKLKEQLKKNRSEVLTEVSFIGRLADISEHKYHDLIQGEGFSKEEVHRDLIIKAQEMYLQNHSVEQILESLNTYVTDEMFWKKEPPDLRRRRYHPTRKDILNFITRIRNLSRFTHEEEEKIGNTVDEIKKINKRYKVAFQVNEENITENIHDGENRIESSYDEIFDADPNDKEKRKKEERKVQTFLFCYQTPSQQRLMRMYSNVSYLMELHCDASLKSTLTYRCYLLIVQTNVDYQVVGFIAVSKQRKNGLAEGLKLFQEWNSFWKPKYMFVDYTESMFDAVSLVFPDAGQFLNLHSCENKWMEFANTPSNDVQEHREEIIGYLRGMQYSLTEESLSNAAGSLEGSEVWQTNDKLRRWFQGKWLHLAKCWVFGYRPEDLVVMHHLNFTTADCMAVYKDAFSLSIKGEGFVEMLGKVTNNISHQEYEKYVKRNNEHYIYYHQFSKSCVVSAGLQGVPKSILPYVDQMYRLSQQNKFSITEDQTGMFGITCEDCDDTSPSDKCITPKDIHYENRDSSHGDISNNDDGNCSADIESFETDFSSIRYLNKTEVGSFTVSFGDLSCYPFCTCSYWNTYKLPCVHMIAVFCNVPGWRFHMLSPLYQFNPVINIDYSSINQPIRTETNDKESQTSIMGKSVATQIDEIPSHFFENPSKIPVTETLLRHTKVILEHIRKTAILFKNKLFHNTICKELQSLIVEIQTELTNKVKLLKSLNFFTVNVKNSEIIKEINETHSYTKLSHQQALKIDLQGSTEINEINEKLTTLGNLKTETSSIDTEDILQTSVCNIPDKRSHFSIMDTINACNEQIKKRKLSHDISTGQNNKKSSLPFIIKQSENVFKVEYRSKPVLPSGMITLKHLTGKNQIQHELLNENVEEKCLQQINENTEVDFTRDLKTNEEYIEDQVSEKKTVNLQVVPTNIIPGSYNNNNNDIESMVHVDNNSTGTSQSQYICYKVGKKPSPPRGTITLSSLTGKNKYEDIKENLKEVNEEHLNDQEAIENNNEVKKGCG